MNGSSNGSVAALVGWAGRPSCPFIRPAKGSLKAPEGSAGKALPSGAFNDPFAGLMYGQLGQPAQPTSVPFDDPFKDLTIS